MTTAQRRIFAFFLCVLCAPLMAEDNAAAAQRMVREVMASVDKIDSDTLKAKIDKGEDFVLLDVRMPSEIKRMGRIKAPQQLEMIPRGWLEVQIFNHVVDTATPIVVYCGGGIRSALATRTLKEMGFKDVRNYEEGLIGWERKGYPVEY